MRWTKPFRRCFYVWAQFHTFRLFYSCLWPTFTYAQWISGRSEIPVYEVDLKNGDFGAICLGFNYNEGVTKTGGMGLCRHDPPVFVTPSCNPFFGLGDLRFLVNLCRRSWVIIKRKIGEPDKLKKAAISLLQTNSCLHDTVQDRHYVVNHDI